MIKKLAWDTFKNTGDIKTFLEFKRIEELEENLDYTENNEKLEEKFKGSTAQWQQ